MGLQGPILAATDLSEASGIALRQARTIAGDLGAPLLVCHVLPEALRARVLFPHEAGTDTSVQAQMEERATAAVRHQIAAVLGGGSESIPVHLETGSAHAGILTVAERVAAGLIVLGPGPTAAHVARSAPGPVLIARASASGGVLAATDFSDPSLPAVHAGADEARRRGVALRVIHCLDFDETAYMGTTGLPGMIGMTPLPPSVFEHLETGARAQLADAVRGVAPAEAILTRGRPAAAIVEAAGATATELIVVGTRGRSGLARIALGSVAESVVAHAPCSVLTVPLHPA